jgi:hypothetical protein
MVKPQQITITRKPVGSPPTPPTPSSEYTNTPPMPEHRGWDAIKRTSGKHFSRQSSVPQPLNIASVVITKPVPAQAPIKRKLVPLPATPRPVRPLNVDIPARASKTVNLEVPGVKPEDEVSNDPVIRQKRSAELVFADPTLVGKSF